MAAVAYYHTEAKKRLVSSFNFFDLPAAIELGVLLLKFLNFF